MHDGWPKAQVSALLWLPGVSRVGRGPLACCRAADDADRLGAPPRDLVARPRPAPTVGDG